jgi:hypothetical protein
LARAFAAFVGRFVEKNPGKVLFTAASTPIILANSAAIFGDGEIVFDADGNVFRDANGNPVRQNKGLIPRAAQGAGEAIKDPVQTTLYWAGGIFLVLFSLYGVSKVWKHNQKDRLEVEMARNAALSSIPTRRVSEEPITDAVTTSTGAEWQKEEKRE